MKPEVRLLNLKWIDKMHWNAIGAFLLCHSYAKIPDKAEDVIYKHLVKNGLIIC